MENLTPTCGNGPRITAEAITKNTRFLITMLKRGMALLFVLSAVLPVAAQTPAATDLFSFAAPNGTNPFAGLIQARDGNFYGTTVNGGNGGLGTVFKMTPSGVLTTLHSFSNTDGANPYASLIQASDGNLYGTTFQGGSKNDGTVFQITPSGTLTTLYAFSGSDGEQPYGGLLQASDGNLYGVTQDGGNGGNGVLFRLTGVYLVPALTGLSPASRNAGGPAFPLTVKGASFQPFSTIYWNGASLATTYVSASALKATVPASLIATPGTASITVITGAGGGTSKAKTFTILLTTLKLTAASLTKNSDGSYTANITLKNTGYLTAPSVKIATAILGAASTSTALPVSAGSLAAGSTGSASLTFPASAGASGTVVSLKVSGTFTGGKFSGSLKVKLP